MTGEISLESPVNWGDHDSIPSGAVPRAFEVAEVSQFAELPSVLHPVGGIWFEEKSSEINFWPISQVDAAMRITESKSFVFIGMDLRINLVNGIGTLINL
jgi:hypothetical protein